MDGKDYISVRNKYVTCRCCTVSVSFNLQSPIAYVKRAVQQPTGNACAVGLYYGSALGLIGMLIIIQVERT